LSLQYLKYLNKTINKHIGKMAEEVADIESQLANIVELLEESPNDEALLALKKDMVELLELSRASIEGEATTAEESAASTTTTAAEISDDLPLPPPPPVDTTTISDDLPLPPPPVNTAHHESSAANEAPPPMAAAHANIYNDVDSGVVQTLASIKKVVPHKAKKSSSKKKKVKDFVLPDHLIPTDDDTDAERNKKRRSAKSLKNKYRHEKKEIESSNKQKSWQSFQKKTVGKNKSDDSSIFATKEGVNDRVGVVSKKQLTEFGTRKRHK
jgi:hypothetical protein